MRKIIYLMGGSGCGKTTLAKKLEEFSPEKFYRNIELSTREIREGEIHMYDYNFVSDSEFDNLIDKCFETVQYQFLPSRYGCLISELKTDKINLVVASIEGFLSAVRSSSLTDRQYLINIINDVEPDVQREGRNPKQEENLNKSILYQFFYDYNNTGAKNCLKIMDRIVEYIELPLSLLKTFRNDREKCLEYFNSLIDGNK